MKISELLNELSFHGSTCTKDCSGHEAGFGWARRTGKTPNSSSPSFNKGAAIAHANPQITKSPQPREKGRYAARPKARKSK